MIIKIKTKGIERYLRSHKITYKQLGEIVGMKESTIRRKIVGERPMNNEEWQKIIKAFPSLRYYEKKE